MLAQRRAVGVHVELDLAKALGREIVGRECPPGDGTVHRLRPRQKDHIALLERLPRCDWDEARFARPDADAIEFSERVHCASAPPSILKSRTQTLSTRESFGRTAAA